MHAVDLAAGVGFADIPDPVLTALVDDAAALMSPRPDAASVAAARRELRSLVRGNPIAEAAVVGFSDWEAVRALERMWSVALSDDAEVRQRGQDAPSQTGLANERPAR